MKIVFYSSCFGTVTNTFIRNEVEYFNENHSFRYLCQELSIDQSPGYVKQISFNESPFKRKIRWLLWKNDLICTKTNAGYSKKIKEFLNSFSPDIIHCHFVYEAISLLDNIDVSKRLIILHFHGYDASQMLHKKSYVRKLRKIFQQSPNIYPISVNEHFIHALSRKLRVPPSRFHLLRCGVDLKIFKRERPRVPGKVFLQVSSLSEKKGHEFTLQAFSLLLERSHDREYILILTGDGSRRILLEEICHRLQIVENVKFLGNTAVGEVVKLMEYADCFVHHSVTSENGDQEGIPTAIMEAMAMELPVVSTRHSGIPELVEEGVNGYLTKERDVEAFAEKMEMAIKMGPLKQNRKKIEEFYNLEKHNRELEAFYSKIIASKNDNL